jgi:hypothetical protein
MRRMLLAALTVLSLSSCYVREYRDENQRAYRHERWHGEDVYRREDGRWYARHNNEWVLRGEVDIR